MLISNFIFVYFTEGQAILKFVPKRHNGKKCFKVVVCVWIKVGRGNKKWKIRSQTHIKKKSFWTKRLLFTLSPSFSSVKVASGGQGKA